MQDVLFPVSSFTVTKRAGTVRKPRERNKFHVCKHCGHGFYSSRSDAKFDSDRCRQAEYADRQKIIHSEEAIIGKLDTILQGVQNPKLAPTAYQMIKVVKTAISEALVEATDSDYGRQLAIAELTANQASGEPDVNAWLQSYR